MLKAVEKNVSISTAESCTGGLLAAYFTSIPGTSEVYDRGFITYSEDAKQQILKVDPKILKQYTAVSAEVAVAMVQGVFQIAPSTNYALSVTGYAGPEGKEVGLVYIGYGTASKIAFEKFRFSGDRNEIREQACKTALELCLKNI